MTKLNNDVKSALDYLGHTDDQLMASRVTDDSVILVIDNGIEGCPKITVSKDDLPKPKPAKKPASKKGNS